MGELALPKNKSSRATQSFLKQLRNTDIANINIGTIDDLALLNQNSETHRQVDANLHAFDDLQLLNKKPARNDLRSETLDRYSIKHHENMFKNNLTDKTENTDFVDRQRKKTVSQHKISEFLTPSYVEAKFDGVERRFEGNSYGRSTSLSFKSNKKKKTQQLNRLYEFDPEDDPDPYYEIYDCQRMTFLEAVLNKPMNSYVRVDLKQSDSFFKPKPAESKKEEQEPKPKFHRKRITDSEKSLRPIYFDKEEDKTYLDYFLSGPNVIDKRAEYYKRKSQTDCDVHVLTTSFYSFVAPTYREKDFKKIDEREKISKEDLKHDKEIIKRYINFDSINSFHNTVKTSS